MTVEAIRKRYIGDRVFYQNVMSVTIPIMIQNGITSFVNMLDNIMVGQVGTLPMSGVSITNQLLMIFNITIFGAVNAAGIFGAQFFGKGDAEGHRNTMRFKFYAAGFAALGWLLVFGLGGKHLVGLFLNSQANSAADAADTLGYALSYLHIMLWTLPLFALTQVYSSTVRETGETILPMRASICAVLVNLCFNYLLIFGHFGFPRMGIRGAAAATVLSRVIELAVMVYGSYRRKDRFLFLDGLYSTMRVPATLVRSILLRGAPLMLNEVLWSVGMAAITQCYSTRGLNAVAAMNINSTIQNVFMIAGMAMGISISILVGQKLGAGKTEEAVDLDRKMIAMALAVSFVILAMLYLSAPLFPRMYNTGEEVRQTAERLLKITALFQPVFTMYNACYFTMRSGGRTVITMLMDSFYTVCINFPLAFFLSRFTGVNTVLMYLAVQASDIPKMILGLYLVHKLVWVRNLTETVS
ncbi:MAG: MATE family efflux transporter [Solobacterium sp.]|nr:MATE family efflux transporter [Solobacterium sp.]